MVQASRIIQLPKWYLTLKVKYEVERSNQFCHVVCLVLLFNINLGVKKIRI